MLTFSAKPRGARGRRQSLVRDPGPGLAPLSQNSLLDEPRDSQPQPLEAGEASKLRGWHDSSVELRRGLEVTEDVPLDTLPADLASRFGERWR